MTSTAHRIAGVSVQKMWGYRNIDLTFSPHVNILIGPNASGKTTILNLLYYTLSGDFNRLADIQFSRTTVFLEPFDGGATATVSVRPTEGGFFVVIDGQEYGVPLRVPRMYSRHAAGLGRENYEAQQVAERLSKLVPAVWLPVSRRLPVPEEGVERMAGLAAKKALESVDDRLSDLLQELQSYRLRLEARLTLLYKAFERQVLALLLYSKETDQPHELGPVPSENEKQQLIRAFGEAGLLDKPMKERIDEHFEAARRVTKRMQQKGASLTIEDVFVIPLVRRTKMLVEYAHQLELDRDAIFAPLRSYERLVNGFLDRKRITVTDEGKILIRWTKRLDQTDADLAGEPVDLQPEQLSSGEKQLLILLTQAILREGVPVVYVADEPELSLHVRWQERLLKALLELGKDMQIIVATHSPDIVGPFRNNVIDLSKV